jgi:hypothetical protein
MIGGRSEVHSIQQYVIDFVMTGGRSEVYSAQPYVIVCDVWRQIRGVINTTLCNSLWWLAAGQKSFSNEIKSRTFSRWWLGYCLFWLCKWNTKHKIPGISAVYWVVWFVESGVYRTAIKLQENESGNCSIWLVNFLTYNLESWLFYF